MSNRVSLITVLYVLLVVTNANAPVYRNGQFDSGIIEIFPYYKENF